MFSAYKAHVSDTEFPQDSKYLISFLLRCEELPDIPVNNAHADPNRALNGHAQDACMGRSWANPRRWLAYET